MADLESISKDLSEVKADIKRMFQPNGVCDSRHGTIRDDIDDIRDHIGTLEKLMQAIVTQVKYQWVVLGIFTSAGIATAIKVIFFGG